MEKIILAIVLSFAISIIVTPLIIRCFKRFAYSQTILKYVEEHKGKQGTPTMGGIVFFVCTYLLIFFFLDYKTDWFLCLLVATSFALLGGMDDFIKIKFKRNLGLKPYQKIVGQVGISLIFALYIFYNVSTSIYLPFFNNSINVKAFIIPIIMLVFLATTNSVNLTDGLDGLCSNVSIAVMFISIIIFTLTGISQELSVLFALFIGAILGFLVYNTNKASIFMGDLGSLGIGGLISAVFCLTGLELSLLILGICFVGSSLSVIIQVFAFQKFKRRVFKMSPLHHHFQQSGFSEAKITFCYTVTTLMLGLLLILSYL